ncbi:MAG: hypothetical protein BWK79_05370 [Beggiatoa sp. IS2]|nr:MAG: hypothetical protein BWK79_05370 [Beggiatoa sp. IS2]
MNNKNLTILAIITLIGIIVAAVLTQQQETPRTVSLHPVVFPKLMATINEVDEVTINTAQENFTLLREQDQWGLKEKYQYPVALDKVRKVLLGMAELTLLEEKTANPELYPKLEVEDTLTKEAKSTLLTLKAKGQTVATLIIGRDQTAKIDPTRREIYIRKPDEQQSWSAFGLLPVEKKLTDWLDKEIVNVDGQRVRQVNINHPEGEQLTFSKKQPKDSDYTLADMPEQATLSSPQVLKQVANVLSFLNLEDVVPAKEIEFTENLVTKAIFTTFDGLEVTVVVLNKEGKHYAQFSTRFVPEAVVKPQTEEPNEGDKTTTKSEEKSEADKTKDVEQEASILNAKFNSWVFVLPDYKVGLLAKKRDELIKIETPKQGETSPELGHATTTSNGTPLEVPTVLNHPTIHQ